MHNAFSKLRQKQKFVPFEVNDVEVKFGKYNGLTFKQISKLDPDYLQSILDTQDGQMSQIVRERLRFWLEKSTNFWI